MSFPRYPKYKDSGVEWLGEVPEHWNATRLKFLGKAIIGLTYSPSDICDNDEGTLVLRASNIQDGKITLDDNVYVSSVIPEKLVTEPNDILICSRSGSRNLIGKNVRITDDGAGETFGAFMTVFRSRENAYLSKVLNSHLFEYQSSAFLTSTINQLTVGVLNNFKVPMPPSTEQTTITAFLDRETVKIDGLVAEQRRLMELLKEKRQAVISHAVTKGLNPNAPMKPSGIKWLGEVPEHWGIQRLKFVTAGVKAGPFGSALTKDVYVSAGFRVYGQEQVIPNDFTVGDYFITPEKYAELSQYRVSTGDILISCVGTFGKIAIVPDNIEAASLSDCRFAALLLRAGANPNALSPGGSPLHRACNCGRENTALLLLENGADPNLQDQFEAKTPLHAATEIMMNRDFAIVTMLLAHGADPSIRDKEGKTALNYAEKNEHPSIAKILRQSLLRKPRTTMFRKSLLEKAHHAPIYLHSKMDVIRTKLERDYSQVLLLPMWRSFSLAGTIAGCVGLASRLHFDVPQEKRTPLEYAMREGFRQRSPESEQAYEDCSTFLTDSLKEIPRADRGNYFFVLLGLWVLATVADGRPIENEEWIAGQIAEALLNETSGFWKEPYPDAESKEAESD